MTMHVDELIDTPLDTLIDMAIAAEHPCEFWYLIPFIVVKLVQNDKKPLAEALSRCKPTNYMHHAVAVLRDIRQSGAH